MSITNQIKPMASEKHDVVVYDAKNDSNLIHKSHRSIHFTLSPELSMTAQAAKGLNAVMFGLQKSSRMLSPTISEYHAQMGSGNAILSMRLAEFAKLIGAKSMRNYGAIKKTIKEMADIKVSGSNNRTGKDAYYGFYNLFVSAEVIGTTIRFVIPPSSRHMFVNEHSVAVIDFVQVKDSLSSKYSIFLHDMLVENLTQFGEFSGTKTLEFTDEELRNTLKVPFKLIDGIKQFTYAKPSMFISRVLQNAVDEYNSAGLKYIVKGFRHVSGQTWIFDVVLTSRTFYRSLEETRPDELYLVITSLKAFQLSESSRANILDGIKSEKDFEYLKYCVDVTEKRNKRVSADKPIDHKAAYFTTVFKSNREAFEKIWGQLIVEQKLALETERKKAQAELERQKEEHRSIYIKNMADTFLQETYKDEGRLSDFMKAVIEHLISIKHPLSARYRDQINKGDFPDKNDPMVRTLALKVMNITEKDIENYVNNQAIEVNL